MLLAIGTFVGAGAETSYADPTGAFATTPVFAANGQALAIFTGGTVDQFAASALAAQASGAWVQDSAGAFQVLIIGGPSFLQDSFRGKFPSGFPGLIPVTLTRSAASSAVVGPSVPSPTQPAPPSTTPVPPAVPVVTTTPATPSGPFITYPGNGGGPTQCRDGSVSHSSGRGTCSGHGGIAR